MTTVSKSLDTSAGPLRRRHPQHCYTIRRDIRERIPVVCLRIAAQRPGAELLKYLAPK